MSLALPGRAQNTQQAIARQEVELGKKATAIVETSAGTGSAFCIDPTGVFVTNAHVVSQSHGTIHLVLNPGEKAQQILPATILRTDADLDLALLQADSGGHLTALPLGSTDNLFETMPVLAFGYPFGTDLAVGKSDYPSVSVSTGHITALRKEAGNLEAIQLDASLNPGNSGGPVLSEKGEVIGVVAAGIPGANINFAIPVSDVTKFLAKPGLVFRPEPIPWAARHQARLFQVRVIQFNQDAAVLAVSLTLKAGSADARTFSLRPAAGGLYEVSAVPLPVATSAADHLDYYLTVKRGGIVVAETAGSILFQDIPVSPGLRPPVSPGALPAITGTPFVGDATTVNLPAPIDDITVGAGGRYLILWLKHVHKIAVFDVSAAQVMHYLPVEAEDVRIAAGADTLFVALNDQSVLERWSLKTFTRELTVPLPQGKAITGLAIGDRAAGPLAVVTEGKRLDFYDAATFSHEDVKFDQSWIEGNGFQRLEVRAAEDGSMVTAWLAGSPFGAFGITPSDKKAPLETSRKDSEYASYIDYAVPSLRGDTVFTDKSLLNSELQPLTPSPAHSLPVYGSSSYFVTVEEHKTNDRRGYALSVYSSSDRRLLVTLPAIPDAPVPNGFGTEVGTSDHPFSMDQRFYFIAPAHVLITIPDARDQLVLRRFDVMAALSKGDIDYLFVASLPPATFMKGRLYVYQIAAQSRRGGVQYHLDSGPPGMTLSKTGRLEWPVPASDSGHEQTIIVSLHDASGQAVYHTFTIKSN